MTVILGVILASFLAFDLAWIWKNIVRPWRRKNSRAGLAAK